MLRPDVDRDGAVQTGNPDGGAFKFDLRIFDSNCGLHWNPCDDVWNPRKLCTRMEHELFIFPRRPIQLLGKPVDQSWICRRHHADLQNAKSGKNGMATCSCRPDGTFKLHTSNTALHLSFLRSWVRSIWKIFKSRTITHSAGSIANPNHILMHLAKPLPIRSAGMVVAKPDLLAPSTSPHLDLAHKSSAESKSGTIIRS